VDRQPGTRPLLRTEPDRICTSAAQPPSPAAVPSPIRKSFPGRRPERDERGERGSPAATLLASPSGCAEGAGSGGGKEEEAAAEMGVGSPPLSPLLLILILACVFL
jgi:hypothetical protein